ncbi:EAL domain-containing protein [Vibrio sp. AND4]|uniref:EAL domain-containing protein n=1 Tax=Vibrio sp. AND4 TaxID=314289 RepID=UPI00015F3047|nr:EAL domain-containing protein [Vibrio sp. AND4]EDP60397.1 response regulator VieA [Vibrio sp. AND4]
MKILIIEDDPLQSLNLRINLNDLGYNEIDIASSLSDLELIISKNSYFDLAFCDIKMPDCDGVLLLAKYLTPDFVNRIIIFSLVDISVQNLISGMCNQIGYKYIRSLPKYYKRHQLENELMMIFEDIDNDIKIEVSIVFTEQEIQEFFQLGYGFNMYQPQFSFETGELVGVELLMRMRHPEHGVLSPSTFLPQILSLGLSNEMYVHSLREATSSLNTLDSLVNLSMNINQDILEQDLYEITTKVCEENEFPLERLILEITEEQALNFTTKTLENIARLSLKGVRFSVDDFGTGYASLEQLIDLPISEVKIDKRFISNVAGDYKHQQLTIAAVRLAQSLGLQCVAEGVEDKETWEYLKELSVDICQGFYTGKPMELEALTSLHSVVKTQPKKDEKSHFRSILYFDFINIRGQAMVKILSKFLPQNEIQLISNIEILLNLLSENNDHVLVFDTDSLQFLESDDINLLNSEVEKVEAVFISHDYSITTSGLDIIAPTIKKLDNMQETISSLSDYLDEKYNNSYRKITPKLSKREQHVAQLLLAGFTNKYIAYEIGVSQKTVSTFKSRILSKMGVKTTLELSKALNI